MTDDIAALREALAREESSPANWFAITWRDAAFPDRIRRILDRLEAAERDAAWQPIETAPRDGTRVLLYREEWDHPEIIGWWAAAYQCFRSWPGEPWAQPTHWRPLPPPPAP